MGEKYKEALDQKIIELGGSNLRVYINAEGVHPQYKQHLEATFQQAGVRFVEDREEANFIFEGHCEPFYQSGQVVAFFKGEQIAFAGAL